MVTTTSEGTNISQSTNLTPQNSIDSSNIPRNGNDPLYHLYQFPCYKCHKRFRTFRGLSQHLRQSHITPNQVPPNTQPQNNNEETDQPIVSDTNVVTPEEFYWNDVKGS